MTPEAQIQSEIDLLRNRVEDTQELYREACTLLFFRFGVTPTANKLYQYVRKGSMSAPAQALARFWEELRDKSRVRIESPDLPDTLRESAGELLATIWKQALASAQQELEIFRSESRAAVLRAEEEKLRIGQTLEGNNRELERLRALVQETTERQEQAQAALIEERTQKIALDAQLRTAHSRLEDSARALAAARQDFAAELEKMRQALALAEERCQATEKRALLAIDQERTLAAQTQKELQQTRQTGLANEERYRQDNMRLQGEIDLARQKFAGAQEQVDAQQMAARDQAAQLVTLSATLAEKETRLEFLSADLYETRQALTKTEAQLHRLRGAAKAKAGTSPRVATAGTRRHKIA